MKKKFLNVGSGYAMKHLHRSPDVDGQGGGNDAEKSDELKAIESIGDQVSKFKEMLGEKADAAKFEALEAEIKSLKEGLDTLSAKAISESIDKINTTNASLLKQIMELQEERNQGKEQNAGKSILGRREMVSRKQLEDFSKATFKDGKKTKDDASFEIKAAETFGYPQTFEGGDDTDMTAFTGRFVDPVLYKRRRKTNLILDYFDIPSIDVPALVYLQKVEIGDSASISGDPGSAEWILSGQAKPKRSFRVTTGKVEAKKVAIFGTIEDELLQDVPSFENWIRDDFEDEMREKINDGLLNNNPAINPEQPLGLKTNAIQYSATPAYDNTIPEVNYIDMIFALKALFSFNKERLERVFVSSDVHTRIMHLKDNEDRYLNNNLIYVTREGELYIGAVHVVEVDEEDVPSTHVLAVGRDVGFKIKAYGNMVFERGLNGEDFREDKTSYRAYQRFLTYFPSDRENSVLYDTWANIEAAIEAPIS